MCGGEIVDEKRMGTVVGGCADWYSNQYLVWSRRSSAMVRFSSTDRGEIARKTSPALDFGIDLIVQ